jgi:hypothetical protein
MPGISLKTSASWSTSLPNVFSNDKCSFVCVVVRCVSFVHLGPFNPEFHLCALLSDTFRLNADYNFKASQTSVLNAGGKRTIVLLAADLNLEELKEIGLVLSTKRMHLGFQSYMKALPATVSALAQEGRRSDGTCPQRGTSCVYLVLLLCGSLG